MPASLSLRSSHAETCQHIQSVVFRHHQDSFLFLPTMEKLDHHHSLASSAVSLFANLSFNVIQHDLSNFDFWSSVMCFKIKSRGVHTLRGSGQVQASQTPN